MSIISKLAIAGVVAASVATTQGAFAQSTDAQLSEQAEALINKHPALQADHIRIDVVDGIAYVHGDVSSQIESTEASSIVAKVNGVSRVVNVTTDSNS